MQLNLNQLPPLSLYIHIPWCIRKCPYCDFNSHKAKGELPESEYITALIDDLTQALPLIWGRSIETIFIGGGTPSLFSGKAINSLLEQIRSLVKLSPFAEITLEANPGALDNQHLYEYAKSGINRISLGVQSFNESHLEALGRIHNLSDIYHAVDAISKNFSNFNLDIMYGLPNQSVSQALDDVKQAINLAPNHLSCYNLTIEPNTQFATSIPLNLPDNDMCYQMQDELISLLNANNYVRYETSAYSQANQQSKHNLNYWQFGDYLGIGAGAHSKLSFHDKIIRQIRYKHPTTYLAKQSISNYIQQENKVENKDLPFEFMLNNLRLINGFENITFHERTGIPFNDILKQLLTAQSKGFIQLLPQRVVPTTKGQDFLNDLLILFLNN